DRNWEYGRRGSPGSTGRARGVRVVVRRPGFARGRWGGADLGVRPPLPPRLRGCRAPRRPAAAGGAPQPEPGRVPPRRPGFLPAAGVSGRRAALRPHPRAAGRPLHLSARGGRRALHTGCHARLRSARHAGTADGGAAHRGRRPPPRPTPLRDPSPPVDAHDRPGRRLAAPGAGRACLRAGGGARVPRSQRRARAPARPGDRPLDVGARPPRGPRAGVLPHLAGRRRPADPLRRGDRRGRADHAHGAGGGAGTRADLLRRAAEAGADPAACGGAPLAGRGAHARGGRGPLLPAHALRGAHGGGGDGGGMERAVPPRPRGPGAAPPLRAHARAPDGRAQLHVAPPLHGPAIRARGAPPRPGAAEGGV
ncbi:MAG: hypothetical protein AVDCRST_MAG68-5552, partial [uncultured Gemmatimonadetes bacterium]